MQNGRFGRNSIQSGPSVGEECTLPPVWYDQRASVPRSRASGAMQRSLVMMPSTEAQSVMSAP